MPAARNSLIGPDSARVQLRNTLAKYLHDQDPPAPAGYHRWTVPSQGARPSPSLLVGRATLSCSWSALIPYPHHTKANPSF